MSWHCAAVYGSLFAAGDPPQAGMLYRIDREAGLLKRAEDGF
ncbi:MAG: hypothetical protein Q4C13_06645 [Clostridia bacterium]|nr:hypothetical protein [Clostridia bacterium]